MEKSNLKPAYHKSIPLNRFLEWMEHWRVTQDLSSFPKQPWGLLKPPCRRRGYRFVHNYSTRKENRNRMKCTRKFSDRNPWTHSIFKYKAWSLVGTLRNSKRKKYKQTHGNILRTKLAIAITNIFIGVPKNDMREQTYTDCLISWFY